jgi:glycosyltransferase involved in cell wall biosynthesis
MNLGFARYKYPVEGLARGYLSSAYYIWKALKGLGPVTLEDVQMGNPPAPVLQPKRTLHYVPPHWFKPLKGSSNVYFTMWEADNLPEIFKEKIPLAETLIVPSTHNQKVWKQHGWDAFLAPLGVHKSFLQVDPHRSPLKGKTPENPLRFLFVGSQTPRKGWHLIGPAFEQAFGGMLEDANVKLVIKTMFTGHNGRPTVVPSENGKIIVDTRDLTETQMLGLYHWSDVMVFPSAGEGFGLPPLQSMATGGLAVSTDTTGLADFINPLTAMVIPRTREVELNYGAGVEQIKIPTAETLAGILRTVYDEWGGPGIETVRKAGIIKARGFTWENTARKIVEAVKKGKP